MILATAAIVAMIDPVLVNSALDAKTGFSDEQQWQMIAATPKIRIGPGAYATGVIIGVKEGQVYVLTAEHILASGIQLTAELYNRQSYFSPKYSLTPGVVVTRNTGADIAVLRFSIGSMDELPVLKLAAIQQRPKRFPFPIMTIGCDNDRSPNCQSGHVVAKRLATKTDELVAGFFWESEQVPIKGRSGGPMIDSNGLVIGICAATTQGRGYYSHLDEIHVALKKSEDTRWLVEKIK